MEKVKVNICGTDYQLTTDDNETYLTDLAGRIDRAMKEMMTNPRISMTMAAVLVALEQADTAQKALAAADNLRAQMKGYLDDNAHARSEAASAHQEAEHLRRENTLLQQKLALMEKRESHDNA